MRFILSRLARRAACLFVMVSVALAASACASSSGRARSGATSAPAARRSFDVRVVGAGPPMIFIPGLASSGAVWDEAVRHFAELHTCHVLTLAGFAGQPAIDGPLLPIVRQDLAAYVRAVGLDHPVVVGHSLGGFLALWLAATEPDLVGAVVAVDALPFLPAMRAADVTAADVTPMARELRSIMASQSREAFREQQLRALRAMITDEAKVRAVARESAKSDPIAVAQATYDLMTTDLRPLLDRVRAPTLVVGTWVGGAPRATRDGALAVFRAQYASLAGVRIVMADRARHFVQVDDPAFLDGEIDRFLAEPRRVLDAERNAGGDAARAPGG